MLGDPVREHYLVKFPGQDREHECLVHGLAYLGAEAIGVILVFQATGLPPFFSASPRARQFLFGWLFMKNQETIGILAVLKYY